MHRILLIEDDDNVRKMLRRTLVAAGYDVQDAANGALGIEYYLHQRSDVVITDIVRPDREGLETIRELRRLHAGVKIIAMSGTRKLPGLSETGASVRSAADVVQAVFRR
jgi:DNA-binding response OmpR family regulator